MNRPSSGVAITSGSPVVSQCASALAATASSSGVSRHQDQVERAVLVIGREQPIERQQAREQRAEPQDRGADPPEQRRSGPMRERHQHHHDQKEQHADAARRRRRGRRAAGRGRSSAASGLHARDPEPQLGSTRVNPDRAVRGRDDQPAAGKVLRASGRPSVVLRRAVERRGRLVEQPDRPRTAISRASDSRRRCPADR